MATATQSSTMYFNIRVNGILTDWAINPNFERETDKAVYTRVCWTAENSAWYNQMKWIPKSILKMDKESEEAELPEWYVNRELAPMKY